METSSSTSEQESMGGETSESTSWVDALPEQFRDAPFIGKADSPETALQAIKDAASYMGQSIRIPSDDASQEDRQAFYQKLTEKAPGVMIKPSDENMDQFYNSLGRPATPNEYNYEPPEGQDAPEDLSGFAEVAHKHGLTQEQFRGIIGEVVGSQHQANEIAASQQREEMKSLSKEWGLAFDGNITAVKNFLRLSDAPEGIVDLITEEAMSPAEIKWLHSIATSTASPTELVQQQTTQEAELTPYEAKNRIAEMMNNPEHPYWNATDPRHKDAIDTMLKYQKAANP